MKVDPHVFDALLARALARAWHWRAMQSTGSNFDQCRLYITLSCDAAVIHAARRAQRLALVDCLLNYGVLAVLALSLLLNLVLACVYLAQAGAAILDLPTAYHVDSWGAVLGFGVMCLATGVAQGYRRFRRVLLELET